MVLACVYRAANSISDIMGMPFCFNSTIIGAVSGMPGLFTTSVACNIVSFVCPPSSKRMLCDNNASRELGESISLSDRNTSNPFALARIAAPTPLRPPPNTTSFVCSNFSLISIYLIFKVANANTAKMIPISQKRTTIFDSGIGMIGF